MSCFPCENKNFIPSSRKDKILSASAFQAKGGNRWVTFEWMSSQTFIAFYFFEMFCGITMSISQKEITWEMGKS